MTASPAKRKPKFTWQALLILLPVFVLAAFGVASLRQDRLLVDQEARERAHQIADALAEGIWTALTQFRVDPDDLGSVSQHDPDGEEGRVAFRIAPDGELVFPPPYASVPAPHPLGIPMLTEEQALLWRAAQTAEFGGGDLDTAVEGYKRFIAGNPPDQFMPVAGYALATLLIRKGQVTEAAAQLHRTAEQYPDAVLESGMPVRPLAQLKLMELSARARGGTNDGGSSRWESICSNAVAHPTLVSPSLLQRAKELELPPSTGTAERWLKRWHSHETARKLHALVSRRLKSESTGLLTRTGIMNDPQFLSNAPGLSRRSNALAELATSLMPRRLFWIYLDTPWLATSEERTEPPLTRPSASATLRRDESASLSPPAEGRGQGKGWSRRLNGAMRAQNSEESPPGHWIVCRPELEVRRTVSRLIGSRRNVPEYFGVSVELAETAVVSSAELRVWEYANGGKGGGHYWKQTVARDQPAILAAATRGERQFGLLKVNVHLTGADLLFARQRDRTLWFGLLILASAAAAVIGLGAAWRAFQRQLRLSEMKTNFVSSVSHELRAPIASVRLLAESLDRGKVADPAKQTEYFRLITQECRRLTALIENVLDFSRIDQGGRQYAFEPTDLRTLLEQTAKLMQPYAEDRKVALVLQPAPGNMQAALDGRAIQQALINLLDNAIKHSPPGATVTVGTKLTQNDDQTPDTSEAAGRLPHASPITDQAPRAPHHASGLCLWVEDSGEGIPPDEHQRIFEPFYRLGSELRRETQGIGIGLSIVKHIAEAHGGKVVVRSAVGQGSRFTMELPLRENSA